jgi:hypothetical protein
VAVKQEESILMLPGGIDNFVMELIDSLKQARSYRIQRRQRTIMPTTKYFAGQSGGRDPTLGTPASCQGKPSTVTLPSILRSLSNA